MCVNLRAPWQGKLAKMPNLYSHSRKHSQQDCLLKNRRGTALRISRARLLTGLLSKKSKRHCSPNLKSQTPNRIDFLKIEEAPLSESRELDSQHDYVLNNRKGTVLRISRARLPKGLLSQKSKRHCSPNLKSQTSNMIAFLKIEAAPFSESREPDPRQDCLFKNRRGTALRTSRARFPWIKLVCNLHTQHQLSRYHRPHFQSALTKLKHVKLAVPLHCYDQER
ncbi:hypothetical protein ACFX11_046210 [Malus domestica]